MINKIIELIGSPIPLSKTTETIIDTTGNVITTTLENGYDIEYIVRAILLIITVYAVYQMLNGFMRSMISKGGKKW